MFLKYNNAGATHLWVEQDFSDVGDEEALEQVLEPDWLDAELDRDLQPLEPEFDGESLPDLREILQNKLKHVNVLRNFFMGINHQPNHQLKLLNLTILLHQK